MTAQVLILAATGHIGGAVLDDILTNQPNVTVVAQVRTEKDSNSLKTQYAQYGTSFQSVIGSYNDPAINAATEASSIVINCGPDIGSEENIRALLSTLAASIENKPKFYIGTTGAARILDSPTGNPNARTWDDLADIDDLLSLPSDVMHFAADDIVLFAAQNFKNPLLHTALVSPTFVSGVSPSLKRPTPLVFPDWIHLIKTLGAGATVNGGRNVTTIIEVKKLARLYGLLVEEALERLSPGTTGSTSPKLPPPDVTAETWGPRAYYFAGSLSVAFHSFMRDIFLPAIRKYAPAGAGGYLEGLGDKEETEIKDFTSTEPLADIIATRHVGEPGGDIWSGLMASGMGINMRAIGSRAEKVFGGKGFKWVDQGEFEFVQGGGNDAGVEEAVRLFFELEGKGAGE